MSQQRIKVQFHSKITGLDSVHPKSNESFHFDLSPALNYPIELHVNGWQSSAPLHWRSLRDGYVVAEGEFLQAPGLPLLFLTDTRSQCLADHIPNTVLAISEIAPWLQFELAQACAYSTHAQELAKDAPLLFILLVSVFAEHPQGLKVFERLVQSKRKDILRFVGVPASNSLVRLIRRIELLPITPWELDSFREVFSDPELLKLLRHHPEPHTNHMRFLMRHRGHRFPGMMFLVDANSNARDISWLCRVLGDVERLSQGNIQHFEKVRTKHQLQEVHDDLVTCFNRDHGVNSEEYRQTQADALAEEHGEFPAPPIPETHRIQALKSWRSLLDEGRTMHHCVGIYDSLVASGDVFIYQMHEPERLTISVERSGHGWILGEARGYCNANPSSNALELVHRWITSNH